MRGKPSDCVRPNPPAQATVLFNPLYYGEFNRVSNALAAIPSVVITQSWANCDLSLEEFGFRVVNPQGQSVHIYVSELDPLRRMAEPSLSATLLERLEAPTGN